jgi:hypothetical protein
MSRIAETAFGDRPYPEAPGFKERGASRDAAAVMEGRAGILRERVYAAVAAAGEGGLTADEAAAAVGASVLAVRPRLTELGPRHACRIVKTTLRRVNASGLSATVWRAAKGVQEEG